MDDDHGHFSKKKSLHFKNPQSQQPSMPYDPAGEQSTQQSNSDVRLQSSDENENNINITKEQELPSLTKEWKMAMDMKYIIDLLIVFS